MLLDAPKVSFMLEPYNSNKVPFLGHNGYLVLEMIPDVIYRTMHTTRAINHKDTMCWNVDSKLLEKVYEKYEQILLAQS